MGDSISVLFARVSDTTRDSGRFTAPAVPASETKNSERFLSLPRRGNSFSPVAFSKENPRERMPREFTSFLSPARLLAREFN